MNATDRRIVHGVGVCLGIEAVVWLLYVCPSLVVALTAALLVAVPWAMKLEVPPAADQPQPLPTAIIHRDVKP